MFWCTLYHFLMIYQYNHVIMCWDPWWCVKSIYWNHDENMIHMCSSGIMYYMKYVFSSFRYVFRVNKHVLMYIILFMMIYQHNHINNIIISSWVKIHDDNYNIWWCMCMYVKKINEVCTYLKQKIINILLNNLHRLQTLNHIYIYIYILYKVL